MAFDDDFATATLPPDGLRTDATRDDEDIIEPGTRLGRYIVLQRIGAGGMAVVYTAFDPELDRKVALKLVRGGGEGNVRARLLREAQAMAKLSHPNVVPVYDVGPFGERVFIAMEFVVGRNGREWLVERRPSRREVLDVYEQAGRGLAAAHAAGFVHRDFKPENILIGDDGRVRVTDFGLVRLNDASECAAAVNEPPEPRPSHLAGAALTRADALMGTPYYMAPEQFLSETVGPAADQFAFAVSLYEALYGQRPFARSTVELTRSAVLSGTVAPPAKARGVPRGIRRVLLRGLAREPAARWPTLEEFIAALRADPLARWRRLAAVALAAGLVATVSLGSRAARERESGICSGAPARLAGVWDEAVGRETIAAIDRAGGGRGVEIGGRVRSEFDRYAAAWSGMYRDACEATRVRKEQTEEQLVLRMDCLEDRRRDIRALVAALRAPGGPAPARALEATTRLPPLSACADLPALLAPTQLPPDPALRGAVDEVRERLAKGRSELATAAYVVADATAADAVERARRTGFEPIAVEALALRGKVLQSTGQTGPAEAVLLDALEGALRVRHDRVAVAVLTDLAYVVGYDGARVDEGLTFARLARAMLPRLRERDELEAGLHIVVGSIHTRANRLPAALAEFRRGLAIAERVHGARSAKTEHFHLTIANTHLFANEYDQARPEYELALAIARESGGPENPRVAQILVNLGELHFSSGDPRASLEAYREAARIWVAALGPTYARLSLALAGSSRGHRVLGELDAAEADARSAVELSVSQPSNMPIDARHGYEALARVLVDRGRHAEAIPHAEQALAICKREPADLECHAELLFLLARAFGEGRSDVDKALRLAREADAVYAKAGLEKPRAEVATFLARARGARR